MGQLDRQATISDAVIALAVSPATTIGMPIDMSVTRVTRPAVDSAATNAAAAITAVAATATVTDTAIVITPATAMDITTPGASSPSPRDFPNAGAPVNLWLETRVHRVEKTKKFRSWQERANSRKQAAHLGVETRVDDMVEKMRSLTITIKRGLTTAQATVEIHQAIIACRAAAG